MSYSAKDKVFLITGGASGLGEGMTRAFFEQGAKYIAVLDVAEDAGIALAQDLNDQYGNKKVKFIKCDVTDEENLNNAYETVIKEAGYIDVVINNAGIFNDSPKMFKKEININLTAVVAGSLKALDIMRKDQGGNGGTIINIASVAAFNTFPELPIYGATKKAVLHFSISLGQELHYKRTGVRVMAICFGATDTPILNSINLGAIDKQTEEDVNLLVASMRIQKQESAVRAVTEAFKLGKSGSTWMAMDDKPPEDITPTVDESYSILRNIAF